LSRREGGKIFGSGSRTPIAITLFVKRQVLEAPPQTPQGGCASLTSSKFFFNPQGERKIDIGVKGVGALAGVGSAHGLEYVAQGKREQAVIEYRDIGDYLTREGKLATVAKNHDVFGPEMGFVRLIPNEHGDWLNQRNDIFTSFIPLGDKDNKSNEKTVFAPWYSNGLKTNADAWMYNFSSVRLAENMELFVKTYNDAADNFSSSDMSMRFEDYANMDPSKIKWHSGIIPKAIQGKKGLFDKEGIIESIYRPFNKEYAYFDAMFVQRASQLPSIFPTSEQKNLVICVSAGDNGFPLICSIIPDLHFNGDTQCFPLYYYEEKEHKQKTLFDDDSDDYIRRDGVTDFILKQCRERYSPKVTKEDIFYYVYGLLHSPDYRAQFSADLKKMLPRLPLVDKPADFWAFSKAGRELAEQHINYEDKGKPGYNVIVTGDESGHFEVDKMRFIEKDDKTGIRYNPWITITNIPFVAYEYVVNGKSAIEWVMERYQVKTDKDSQIKNDPNDWAVEHGKPRYILDLLLSVINVSVETVMVVEKLPRL
jgi:predicted helicase